MKRGQFITFEGIDGSGKTTQIDLLVEHLQNRNLTVTALREPGNTSLGEAVRSVLLGLKDETTRIDRIAEYLLFAAARAQFTSKVLIPALKKHDVVISDRFGDSSVAYQGYGHGVDIDLIKRVNLAASEQTVPDMTLLMDIEVEEAFSRIKRGSDRMEKHGHDFFKRVRDGYLEMTSQEPNRIHSINATRDIELIQREVRSIVDSFLAEHKSLV